MSGGFHESFEEPAPSPPSDRATGLTLAALAALLALVNRHGALAPIGLGALALLLAVLSLIRPALLAPLNRAWFALGRLLHTVMSPLVMGLVFALAIVPLGLLLRPWHDPLVRRRRPAAATYWIDVAGEEARRSAMTNQF